jgi:cytochrome c-type biogenesis protein CcmH
LNNYFVLAAVVVVCISAVLLWYLQNSTAAKAARARRRLLLDRAEGRISKEEFDERQAAVDSVLLDTSTNSTAWPIVAAIVGAGVVTASVLSWLGSSTSVSSVQPAPSSMSGLAASSAGGGEPQPKQGGDLRDLARPLADRLASNPDDGAGWMLLARTYVELRQFKEAVAAFEKASRLVPPDVSLLVDWAGAHVAASDGTWTPAARDILKKALALDSSNLKVLTLAVAEADSRGDSGQAGIYRKQVARLSSSGPTKSIESELSSTQRRPETSAMKLPALPSRAGN